MRKKRLLIASVLIFFVLAGLYDMVKQDRLKITPTPNEDLHPVNITVISHTPNDDLDPATITVITHTPNDDLGPVWSPDGAHIAFVGHHEGNPEVYVLDMASGGLTNVSNSPIADYNPSWSPDGRYLAFWRRDAYGSIHVVVRDLTAGTEVESPNHIFSYAPRPWSPDSQQLFFTGHTDGMWCISVYGVHSASYQNLVCPDPHSFTTLSPDAHWMLIRRHEMEAELVDLESGQSHDLNEVGNTGAVWALDSHAFAYQNEDRTTICIYDVSVHRSKCLILPKTDEPSSIIGWSPTGQLAWAEQGFPTKFYVMEPHADTFREVATMDEIPRARVWYPSTRVWSPHGQFIGFNTYGGVYVLDTVTGTLQNPVYSSDYIEGLQWSPDGRYLSAFRGDNNEIALFDVDTGNMSLISGHNTWTGPNFDWSPDGTRLVFSCGRQRVTNLCLFELP